MKSVMSCLSFTAVMIQINHSVTDKHLGKVMRLSRFILHTSHFTLRTRSPSHKYCTLSSPPPFSIMNSTQVNGFGQSIASLARSLGPALGGILWSMSIHKKFVYFNFIATSLLLMVCLILNQKLPLSLDSKKKGCRVISNGGEGLTMH